MDWTKFQKPQRYQGNEWNVIKKSHYGKIKICLCFPDLYEVGMSNLGLRIIYGYLNSFSDVVCERAFMPDGDLYNYLFRERTKLFSLETKTSLSDFELLGFNLGYELNYTNFIAMLTASGIELKASCRRDMIILGGGAANPEPLCDFVDVFLLGEFEVVADKLVDTLRRYKTKQERLQALAEIDGFYIPSFYNLDTSFGEYIFEKRYKYAKLPLKKVFVKDLDSIFYPTEWLTPYSAIVHDRAQVEIARGCPNNCYFCQARCVYFPYRERKADCLYELVKTIYKNSGYENFSLLALSASDYSQIEELIDRITGSFDSEKVGLSLPSLRVEDVVDRLYPLLRKIKRVSATFAVEAARQCLRDKINKRVDIDRLFEAAKVLRSLGSRHIKLYFMFGFPFEDDNDLLAIGDFVKILKKKTHLSINLSINAFVPKPFSEFQGINMESESRLKEKRKVILSNLPRDGNIKVSISSIEKSLLEAVISRADRKISPVLYEAFRAGAVFDSYSERSNSNLWQEAFKRADVDPERYLLEKKDNFSFSHIQMR
ncbi:MAG: TIGR03960 family B12-binding radical SAM protein [Candidatus Omnitrophota bacterium]